MQENECLLDNYKIANNEDLIEKNDDVKEKSLIETTNNVDNMSLFQVIGAGIMEVAQSETLKNITKVMYSVAQSINDVAVKIVTSPFIQWLQTVDVSPLIKTLNEIIPKLEQYYSIINTLILNILCETRWFPYANWNEDDIVLCEVIEIIEKDLSLELKTKNIDRIMFTYYSKEKIESMRVSWKALGLPKHTLKILNEAVRAYHRREHALTVLSLVPFWEGVIADKTHCPNDYHVSGRTRQNLEKLLKSNNVDDAFKSYCDDFIFYDCRNKEGYKDDVPGRHAYSHSWFTSYPNRKAALNAILFTDFLFRLDEILVEDNEEEKGGI